jgi:two-component system, cell cycle sensor histidine kinase and response regulator CckA
MKASQTIARRRRDAEAILESLADPVVAFDKEWRYTYVSRRAAQALRKAPEEMIGRCMWDLFPGNVDAGFQAACQEAWAEGRPVTLEHYSNLLGEWVESYISPFEDGAAAQWRSIAGRKAEEALRASEERNPFLAGLLEQADQPFGIGYPDGRIGFVNSAFARLGGYSRDEIAGVDWNATATPPEWREREAAKLEELHQTGRPVRYEKEYLRKDGTRVPVELLVHLATDDRGLPIYYSFATDLSVRKHADEALRASEERFRRLVEVTSQIVWVTDAQGQPQADSPSWRAFTGWSLDRFLGWNWLEAIHPDDRPRVAEVWRTAVNTAEPCTLEFRQLHASGEYRHMSCHAAPLFNPDGTVREWIGMDTDITDRKRAEQALAGAIQRLDAHMDNSPLAVIEFDSKFRVTRWSKEAERIFGWSTEEIVGRALAEVRWVHADDVEAIRQLSQEMLDGKRPRNFSTNRNYRKDGSIVECEWYNSAIYDGTGKLASILSQVLDVTVRKRAEERLRQAQKMESIAVLAGGVAHDFNNLLVGVIGNASLAIDMLPPGSPAVEALELIIKSGEQAAHLTRQMLAYSGRGQFFVEPVYLSDVVREVTALVRSTAPKKIAIQLELDPDLPEIQADRTEIHQALMNLVINATEAIGDQAGLIVVRTGSRRFDEAAFPPDLEGNAMTPGRYVFLEVRDTGCGMDEATKAKIFDPFFTTKFQGRGLGLAAVAGIVRGHKGAIGVTSAPGQGTSFFLLFPALDAGRRLRSAPGGDTPQPRPSFR